MKSSSCKVVWVKQSLNYLNDPATVDWDQNPQTSTPNQRDLRSHAGQLLSLVVQSCVRPLHTSISTTSGSVTGEDRRMLSRRDLFPTWERSPVLLGGLWFGSVLGKGSAANKPPSAVALGSVLTQEELRAQQHHPRTGLHSREHGPPPERRAFMPPSPVRSLVWPHLHRSGSLGVVFQCSLASFLHREMI